MKMIGHDHFICHSYCHFSVLSHILLSDRTCVLGRSLMTSSDSVSKIISCCFSCFVSDFSIISMAFAVCIPKKIHSISVFLFLAFILESE